MKEYIVKGFALNDERFKSGTSMNYFMELQERIREIRLSERFFYQKIKDIYTTSVDYDPKDERTIKFFKVVQNKLLCSHLPQMDLYCNHQWLNHTAAHSA